MTEYINVRDDGNIVCTVEIHSSNAKLFLSDDSDDPDDWQLLSEAPIDLSSVRNMLLESGRFIYEDRASTIAEAILLIVCGDLSIPRVKSKRDDSETDLPA